MPGEVQTGSKRPLQGLERLLAPAYWLERTRGWRRGMLLLGYVLIGAGLSALVARTASLRAVPDVGDPFDVEAFVRDQTTPPADEDANAFTWYQRALSAAHAGTVPEDWLRQPGRAIDDPVARYLLLENRLAFECWLLGTNQDTLVELEPGAFTEQTSEHRLFQILARVETEWLMSLGEMDDAWRSCRALLRFNRHLARPGRPDGPGSRTNEAWGLRATSIRRRIETLRDYRLACMLAETWAIDPSTSAEALRRAIEDFAAIEPMAPPSESLRAFYLDTMRQLEQIPPHTLAAIKSQQAQISHANRWYARIPGFIEAHWFLRAEPERGRRIIRLVLAKWLDNFETPPDRRPPRFESGDGSEIILPLSTRSGHAADARTIARWYRSSSLARRQLSIPIWLHVFDLERELYEQTMFTLLSEWHLRAHGTYPDSVADLDPILEVLPEADATAMRRLVPDQPLDAIVP